MTNALTPAEQQARFQRWMRDHAAILYRVAAGFASGVDRDDLMQELLIALWRAIPAFRGEAQAATFIYRVSHHAALSWKRSERRRDAWQAGPAALEGIESGGGADDDAADRELLERVYAGIRELPALDRSLVLLSLDGLSHREMALIHGLSEGNVGVRLHRGRARLALSLKEWLDDPR